MTQNDNKDGQVMMSAHSLCPSEMSHPERMRWIAKYFLEHREGSAEKDLATFEELLDDLEGAVSETAVFNITQRSMTVRMVRPRREKLLKFVEDLLSKR